jgi:ADP-ribose diphosphatase
VDQQPAEKPQVVYQGRRFRVVRRTYRTPDGREHVHETVVHPGAVTILPLVNNDAVCLIRNFRPSVGQTLLELPAGTLEPGEDPLTTARRELEEETGYQAEHIEPLLQFFMSPGILNERMHLYLATGLVAGAQSLDAGEQIENLVVPWSEALTMARDGRIQDAKSLAGLLYYEVLRRDR